MHIATELQGLRRMIDLKEFGRRLQEERKRLGLTQEELGQRTDLSRAAQATYEGGKAAPDIVYMALAGDAGIDVNYVLSGQRSGMTASALFDWDTAEAVFLAIHELAREARIEIPPEKFFRLFRLLYEPAVMKGRVDAGQVKAGIELFAA